jgi:hypothetical protein
VTGGVFFIGFAIIGITGLLAALIALGGPKTQRPLARESQTAPVPHVGVAGVI